MSRLPGDRAPYQQSTFFVPVHGFVGFAPCDSFPSLSTLQRTAALLLGAPWPQAVAEQGAPRRLLFAREVLQAALATEGVRPKRAEPLWRVSDAEWARVATDSDVARWLEARVRAEALPDPEASARAVLAQVHDQLLFGVHVQALALESAGHRMGRRALHAGAIHALKRADDAAVDVDLAIALGAYVPSAAQFAQGSSPEQASELLFRAAAAAHLLPLADRRALSRELSNLASRTLKNLLADVPTGPSDQLTSQLDAFEVWLVNTSGTANDWCLLAAGRLALGRYFARHVGRDAEAAAQFLRAVALGNEAAGAELDALAARAEEANDSGRAEAIAQARSAFMPEESQLLAEARSCPLSEADLPPAGPFVSTALRDLEHGWQRFCDDVARARAVPRLDRWTARRWMTTLDDAWLKGAAAVGIVLVSLAYVQHARELASASAREAAYVQFDRATQQGDAQTLRAAGRAVLAAGPDPRGGERQTKMAELYRAALLEAARGANSAAQLAEIFRENSELARVVPADQAVEL